jgi:hypothetical protein
MKPTSIVFTALLLSLGTHGFAAPNPRPVGIRNGAVTAPKIAAGAVTESKIAAGAVTESKIAAGAVTESKIADGAVTESKIAPGSVTTTKLGSAIGVWAKNGPRISYTAGQVLVGTTSPTSNQVPLIIRSGPSNHAVRFETTGGNAGWEIFSDPAGLDFTEANVATGRLYLATGGNVGIGTTSPSSRLHVIGEARATVFTPTSDRNAKQDFTPVDSREVLAKVVALPITEWQYKTIEDARHMGPVAQDFRKAFGLGSDDKGISTVDADGVALAAIQGLNQLVEEKDAEITRLEERLAQLEERLNDLVK